MEQLSEVARRLLDENDETARRIAESETPALDQVAVLDLLIQKLLAASKPAIEILRGPLRDVCANAPSFQDELQQAILITIQMVQSVERDPSAKPGELAALEAVLRQLMGVRFAFEAATLAAKRVLAGLPISKLLFALAEQVGKLQVEANWIRDKNRIAMQLRGLKDLAKRQEGGKKGARQRRGRSAVPKGAQLLDAWEEKRRAGNDEHAIAGILAARFGCSDTYMRALKRKAESERMSSATTKKRN